jgi:hypothetical protein
VSPILTRPVREQFEHDRIIRLLQARYRRKFEVAINLGPEQNTPVAVGEQSVFPDLVLFSQDRGHKLQGTVEVETGESVNTLEAMSQWALFSRLRAPFALYVPPSSVDTARRLCVEHNIPVSEIWTYHTALDQVRFTMVQQTDVPAPKPQPKPAAPPVKPAVKDAKPVVKETKSSVTAVAAAKAPRTVAKAAPKPASKPVAKPAAKKPVAKAGAAKAAASKPVARPAAAKAAAGKPAASKAAPKAAKRKVAPPAKRR